MRGFLFGSLVGVGVAFGAGPCAAEVQISVDLTKQVMHVTDDGRSYAWPVSTAVAGYSTPTGVFHPVRFDKDHLSKEYDDAPMPYSIFFKDGTAIHGTNEVSLLGRPASHGCVHLSVAHAALLYKMVKADGATIAISGRPPRAGARLIPVQSKPRRERPWIQSVQADDGSYPPQVQIPADSGWGYPGAPVWGGAPETSSFYDSPSW